MAIGAGSLIEIALSQRQSSQELLNVFQYEVTSGVVGVGAQHIAEAWWAHVSSVYRAIVPELVPDAFNQVSVRELDDPSGEYAVYGIPTAQRSGTRTSTGTSNFLPPFNSCGIRLTVGTRVTRPGQKRLAFLTEVDSNGLVIDDGYLALARLWAERITAAATLGAPAALMVLQPVIVRKNPETGLPIAHQNVTGFVINSAPTSQVSRKIGHGG